MSTIPYTSVVGTIMHGMVYSRPKLAFAVSGILRFMANPRKAHWEVRKWTLRYLKRTKNFGLLFGKHEGHIDKVVGFVDYDFVGSLDTSKSPIGYIFTVFGTLVSWKSNL